jgi:hypothetical protein
MPVVRAEHNYFLSEGKKAMSPKEYHNMIHAICKKPRHQKNITT